MLKKTVTYSDLDGRVHTEDFYFNLTKAEVLELEVSRAGGFAESLKFLAESRDQKALLAVIKEVILKAYGEKSDVSRHFVKKPEFAEAFSHTEAFSTIFMDLFGDAKKASDFFNALLPADMLAEAKVQERPQPQDYQKKAEPDFQKVDLPVEQEGVEIQQPVHHPSMSPASFQALAPEDAAQFIRQGGQIDPSL